MKSTAYLFSAVYSSCDVDSTQFYKPIVSYTNILNSQVQHTAKPINPRPHPEPSTFLLQV